MKRGAIRQLSLVAELYYYRKSYEKIAEDYGMPVVMVEHLAKRLDYIVPDQEAILETPEGEIVVDVFSIGSKILGHSAEQVSVSYFGWQEAPGEPFSRESATVNISSLTTLGDWGRKQGMKTLIEQRDEGLLRQWGESFEEEAKKFVRRAT